MKYRIVFVALLLACMSVAAAEPDTGQLDRLRLVGRAHYEAGRFKAAASSFEHASGIASKTQADSFNRALALTRDHQHDAAREVLDKLDDEHLGVSYLRGIISQRESNFEEAVRYLRRVSLADPECFGAFYNLGVSLKASGELRGARDAFATAAKLDPGHPSAHYQLMTLNRALGDDEAAGRATQDFMRLKDTVDDAAKTVEALERSRYSELMRSPPLGGELTAAAAGAVTFSEGPAFEHENEAESAALGGAITLLDVDGDGRLDIYAARCGRSNQLWLNRGEGPFEERGRRYGVDDPGCAADVVVGDLDDDGNDDLYVVNDGDSVFFQRQGDGELELVALAHSHPGVALLPVAESLPAPSVLSVDVEGGGFLVFGYRGIQDFYAAGASVDDQTWWIAHYDGSWHDLERVEAPVNPAQPAHLELRIEGGRFELVVPGQRLRLIHSSRAANAGRLGIGSASVPSRFDRLELVSGETKVWSAGFADGSTSGLEIEGGIWQVVEWAFGDVSENAADPGSGRRVAMVDYDHDYDLDLVISNGAATAQPDTVLRNRGDGHFTTITGSGLDRARRRTSGLIFADLDGDFDTDFFVTHDDGPAEILLNQRHGIFAPGGELKPAAGPSSAVVTDDFDHDGDLDLLVARSKNLTAYLNDGRAFFTGRTVPLELADGDSVASLTILDANNDGWSDVLVVTAPGGALHLLCGRGGAVFADESRSSALAAVDGVITAVAVADIDADGDQDVVAMSADGSIKVLTNQSSGAWLRVTLEGVQVNRNGHGASVELAAGGHYQRRAVERGAVHFGLGGLDKVDVLRVMWPNGVVQNVIDPPVNRELTVREEVKVSASCGFLWSSGGDGFELINEILGIGPLGAPIAPGVYHQPDSTELTMISGDQLAAKNGVYELRLSEELREIMYIDRVELRVIDHPPELEIVANEMFTTPPFPEDRYFAVEVEPVRAAMDGNGRDVLDLVREHDERFPTFSLVDAYAGLAESHSLIFDLGEVSPDEDLLLLLDSWIYWPDASTVMAMDQDPRHGLILPSLEVPDGNGGWREVLSFIGLPTSKGLVMPVDLSGLVSSEDPRVRITTNMCFYVDRVAVARADEAGGTLMKVLPASDASLHYRGFSRRLRDEHGYERFVYDDVSVRGPWSPPSGLLTRYGEVQSLLEQDDNLYVVLGPGDELVMTFDASELPDPPPRWKRDFIFFASGWVKDGDLNTHASETVGPLPFHGMSGYPYSADEAYPDTATSRAYRQQLNTRPGISTIGGLPLD